MSSTQNEDFELDPKIYEHYLGLLPPQSLGPLDAESRPQIRGQAIAPVQKTPSPSYITHYWNPQPTNPDNVSSYLKATLLESRTTIESGTTGLRTWLASFVLSQYLILHPELISSKRILELGSGAGFLGIIIASLQRISNPSATGAVWLTDNNYVVLARCRHNVNLPCNPSSSHRNVNYRILDWSASLEESRSPALKSLLNEIDPELVVGADIVFDPSLILALIGTIKLALQPQSQLVSDSPKLALVALTVRNGETMAKFLDDAQSAGLLVVGLAFEFDRTPFLETVEGNKADVRIFQIKLV